MSFPGLLNVRKLVEREEILSGSFPGELLARVAEIAEAAKQDINYELRFGRNDIAKPSVWLKLSGSVFMQCQRCLEHVEVAIEAESEVVFVAHDDEAKSLLRANEPWILNDGKLDTLELLEDEILLALPTVARHPASCTVNGYVQNREPTLGRATEAESEQPEPRVSAENESACSSSRNSGKTNLHRPFEALAALKGKPD